nr:helix-turn-helix domain-containing protein [uncultured Flavobacterium sp.]
MTIFLAKMIMIHIDKILIFANRIYKVLKMYRISDELDLEGFSINRIGDVIYRNKNSFFFETLDFFVIYITFEESEVIVNDLKYSLPKNHLVFVAPHKKIQYSNGCMDNIVIAFSSSFYEKSVKDSFILNSRLFFNEKHEILITPAIGNEVALRNLIVNRLNLYREKEHGIYLAVAHNCVEILLLDGLLALEESSSSFVNLHSTYIETVNKFRVLLQKYYKTEKSVAFYSEKLFISTQRLSLMTKNVLGKGAKKVVVEKLANEALKLIENSTLTISEISNELGFDDEANFSSFVKKNLGKSPSELRVKADYTKQLIKNN